MMEAETGVRQFTDEGRGHQGTKEPRKGGSH